MCLALGEMPLLFKANLSAGVRRPSFPVRGVFDQDLGDGAVACEAGGAAGALHRGGDGGAGGQAGPVAALSVYARA